MDKNKHTSGPWHTQGWVPTWAYIPVKDARHNLVCSLYPDTAHNYTREEVEANACLIAAAPQLLEALIKLSNEAAGWFDYESEMRQVAGNTNFACLKQRVDEARTLVATLAPRDHQ